MKQSERPRVLFVAGDPGGAYALAPVIRQIVINNQFDIEILAYYQAIKVFDQFFDSAVELSLISTEEDVYAWLAMVEPDLVVTASSSNQYVLEKKFIAGARSKRIPTLTILDFWSNYSLRFSEVKDDLIYLPDKIAVIDDLAYREMCAEGFPENRLVITGQPAFDVYLKERQDISPLDIKKTREKLFGDVDKVVLFVSQPFAELFGSDSGNPLYPGYTQQDQFEALFHALESMAEKNHSQIGIGVLPHLRERDAWWEKLDSKIVKIKLDEYDRFSKIALAADLVVGLTSTMLVNAAILGVLTASMQLGGFETFYFDMERFGISKMIYSQPELEKFLQIALFGGNETEILNMLIVDGKSTENVIQLIETMLAESKAKKA